MKIEEYLDYNGSKEEFIKDYLTPAICGGKIFDDYYVDKDGEIWSTKKNKVIILAWFFNKGKQYPRVSLCYKDKVYKLLVHRIVCETFHEVPLPEGVTLEEWKRTPKSIKTHFYHYWEVHHKDHNKCNFHPNNLEWVSCKQNMERYKTYLKEQA